MSGNERPAGHCVLCGQPHGADPASGWRPLIGAKLRCPRCAVDAVETQADARRHLPSVRREMASLGIRLDTPVRVEIVDGGELNDPATLLDGHFLMGVTEQRYVPGQLRTEVIRIRIISGLTPTHFGRAVAHELGHAWLAQRATASVDLMIEEGVCELFAYAWLKRRASALATALRAQLRDNPDPIYGAGFRTVHDAVRRHGIDVVLDVVLRTGKLP